MSPRRCCIPDCKSVSNQQQFNGVKFHAFPSNADKRKIWIDNCRITNNRTISKSVLVCSRHFHDTDFHPPKNGRHLLKLDAVPTIFPWDNIAESTIAETNTKPQVKKINVRSKAADAIENVKQRSASAGEQSTIGFTPKANKSNARKSLDSAAVTALAKIAPKEFLAKSPLKRFHTAASLVPGAKVEVQDLNGSWHNASVVEVDQTEQEVLINFEKNAKTKGLAELNDEWIAMDSSRLRQIPNLHFAEGERCSARWTDSRKFLATVKKVLDDNMYEVLFDDGFTKNVKSVHMSKIKHSVDKTSPPLANIVQTPINIKKPMKTHPIPKFDLTQFNLPEIPNDGEWCCPWVNDTPIGREGFLINADGNKRPTVLVDDWRLPSDWTKHLYQRTTILGKWDVVLVGPNKKRFRSKNDVKVYLESNGLTYSSDIYDFSIHKRRAKDIGVYVFTKDYVPPVVTKPTTDSKLNLSLGSTGQDIKQEPFPGFSPVESKSTALSDTEIKNEFDTPTKDAMVTILGNGYIYVGALRVQIHDNLFQCPAEGCNKSFRKENHLQIHVKHYHKELSEQLGACPNMTELASFRTMGAPIDESSPKNQIPNSQFFEKVYQSELRPNRKSLSPTVCKTEIKTEEVANPQNVPEEHPSGTLKRKSNLSGETKVKRKPSTIVKFQPPAETLPVIEEEPFAPSVQPAPLTLSAPEKTPESLQIEDMNETTDKLQKHSFKIERNSKARGPGKNGRKRGNKKLKKKLRKDKVLSQRALTRFAPRKPSMIENSQNEDTGQLFEGNEFGSTHAGDYIPPRLNRLKFLQYPVADSKEETSSLNEQMSDTPYINENGEMIKIVRMRQEEIINCLCSYAKEDGLMIQCELCLCWQHGGCNGIEKESEVPDKYICYICRNPEHGRNSMKYIHDQDWLYEGKLFHANYHRPSRHLAQRFDILKQSHSLIGNLLDLKRSMYSLNVKINIAANKDHPKMYLWSAKWEQSPPKQNDFTGETKLKIEPNIQQDETVTNNEDKYKFVDKAEFATSETLESGSNKENRPNEETCISESQLNVTPSIVQKDFEEDGSILAHLLISPDGTHNTNNFTDKDTVEMFISQQTSRQILPQLTSAAATTAPVTPNIPEPEAAIDSTECQHRLLNHIQTEQNQILSRMQTIDAQIIALESMEDHPDTNSIADIGKTKSTIQMLLNDLMKLRKLATANQSTIPH